MVKMVSRERREIEEEEERMQEIKSIVGILKHFQFDFTNFFLKYKYSGNSVLCTSIICNEILVPVKQISLANVSIMCNIRYCVIICRSPALHIIEIPLYKKDE